MLGKIESKRRMGQQRMRWLQGHGFEQTPGDGEGQEAWCATVHGVAESYRTRQLSNNRNIFPQRLAP